MQLDSNFSNYLPLTGGSLSGKAVCIMNTDPQFQCKNLSNGRLMAVGTSNDSSIHFLNYQNEKNSNTIALEPETYNLNSCFKLNRRVDGVISSYILYGSHNITKGTSALTSGSSLQTHAIYLQYE